MEKNIDFTQQFNAVMEKLPIKTTPSTSLAVAVSGGVDSMCLSWFLFKWLDQKGWDAKNLHPIIIDHQLREESSKEALHVQKIFKNYFNLQATILVWEGEKMLTRVQEEARKVRYKLLFEYCQQHNISYLFTAHHQDDQIETFFMRAAKGSGIKGLSGIPEIRKTEFGAIVRPLLDFSKKELKKTLKATSIPWVEDPSNANIFYQRNRWRKILNRLSNGGVDIKSIAHRIQNLKIADKKVDNSIKFFLEAYLKLQPYGWWCFDYPIWTLDPELFRRIINALALPYTSPGKYPPRGRHYRHNQSKLIKGEAVTFQGLYFLPKKNSVSIFREPKFCQNFIVDREILRKKEIIWDKRFKVNILDIKSEEGIIAPLTEKGWQVIKDSLPKSFKVVKEEIPGPALFSLPAFWTVKSLSPKILYKIKSIKI